MQTVEQDALNVIHVPTQALLGHPLIGNGVDGQPGNGQNGGVGQLLFSNGGTGRPPENM
ncbi:hypothetical protein [Mycobacterium uberis]|uniref:hypothetical protein n=1 Tax=Mycobacterium uberis TaxID=2162698 RepID=UPI001402A8AE|nr:hypothetical protein [Mycobacterium uberis]